MTLNKLQQLAIEVAEMTDNTSITDKVDYITTLFIKYNEQLLNLVNDKDYKKLKKLIVENIDLPF